MKSVIFVLITISALSSCKGECKYDEPIEGFFVTHWEEALPRHGKVYSFKAGTNFIAENLDYDQLIFERRAGDGARWLHVSYRAGGNRHMVLKKQVKAQIANGALG